MIKTINLTGSTMKVTELGGDNTEIFNNSNDTVYASKLPDITVGGDEVIAIPAGAIDGLYGTRGTLYLLGTGSVELRGVDHKITKARGQSATVIGGTGVSESYVDDKCGEILGNANSYADIKASEVVVSIKEYTDEKDIQTLGCANEYADSLNAELTGYIGYSANDIYGLEVDFENCVFTRLAGAVGKAAGTDFDNVNAYGGRRRCNISDNGDVLAYYGDDSFKEDGSNGQVMVEQPAFYYKVVPLKTEKANGGYILRKARYYISDTPRTGFKIHPAFIEDSNINDKIYLAAYEACVYDDSEGIYCNDDTLAADYTADKLSSIAGAKPASGEKQNLSRANARKLAENRGKGWKLSYMAAVSATELLMLIEYASFDIETALGKGNTGKPAAPKNIKETGRTSDLGNISGTTSETDGFQSMSYRGEENFYGNIWTWVDGVNEFIESPLKKYGKFYVADHNFEDDTNSAPYKDTGIRPCSVNGYISAFGYSEKFDWLFIAAECKGNTVLPIGDYFWNGSDDWNTVCLGGCSADGAQSGAFCFNMLYTSSYKYWRVGARIVYMSGETQSISP